MAGTTLPQTVKEIIVARRYRLLEAMVQGKETQKVGGRVVGAVNKALNVVIAVVLALMFAAGCYDWWDSLAVDQSASAKRWQAYKPMGSSALGFEQLRKINEDVVGWLELYGTGVDYPICYSEDQGYYLGHDAAGASSMTGALFLDRHNAPDFSDYLTIVYGHHMQSDRMFGPLSNYEQSAYFDAHEYGNLHSLEADNGLDVFACVRADAYDTSLFRTGHDSAAERDAQVDAWMGETLNSREMQMEPHDRVLVMSTCSDALTNARTVLLAKVCDQTFENPFAEPVNTGSGIDSVARLLGLPWFAWAALCLLVALCAALVVMNRRKNAADRRLGDASLGNGGGDSR